MAATPAVTHPTDCKVYLFLPACNWKMITSFLRLNSVYM